MDKQIKSESALHGAVNRLLLEIGRVEIETERAAGLLDLEINRLKAAKADRLLDLAARHQDAARKLEALCNEHRAELLPAKAKSLKLLFGKIAWRFSGPSITFARGVDGERAALLLREHGHEDLVRERFEPNKPVILAALSSGQVTQVDLKGAGLMVEPGREEFSAVPDRAEIEKAQGG